MAKNNDKTKPTSAGKKMFAKRGPKQNTRQKPKRRSFWRAIVSNWQAKLLSLVGAIVIYGYYQSAIQDEVSFTLSPRTVGAQDRIVRFTDTRKVTLHLSGRTKDLENLRSSDFETYVRLNPDKNGAQNLPVQYRMRNNDLQLKKRVTVRIQPSFISLLAEKEEVRELPIEISIQGYPTTGYSLGAYRVYPDVVSVSGPASVMQKLEAISTKAIDITGKNQSFQKLADLELLPLPGLEKNVINELELAFERVQVEIQIDARSETQTFSIAPTVVNLPENLKLLDILPGTIQLTLQGNSDIFRQVEEEQLPISIQLDGGDIFASGRYALPVVVSRLPTGLSLLGSTPDRVSLIVSEE
ncbi:CdaR family protein [Candidatus Haliotispira prima]|uniref:CdaR family protein n=1 Tax=Candidatus Haliotispira prima TaxID=3034016 RepID=A0ABY8MMJ6_9SPIO|nr:CdaR family protein [Candidatus Haliotispira prima]